MDPIAVLKVAEAEADAASAAVRAVIDAEYSKFTEPELLSFAQTFETHARLVFTAQVRIAGAIDARKIAGSQGCTSTGALLRQVLTISQPDARARVRTAKVILPQEPISGGLVNPVLPLLGAAMADGEIGIEQTRTIVATMDKLPAKVDPQLRDDVQEALVENGIVNEPKPFARTVGVSLREGGAGPVRPAAASTNDPILTESNCTSAPGTPAPG